MNKHQLFLLRLEGMLLFVDLKVCLLLWILFDLYRSTMVLNYIPGLKVKTITDVTHYIWENNGSPYLIWIPIAAVVDIAIKKIVRAMLE